MQRPNKIIIQKIRRIWSGVEYNFLQGLILPEDEKETHDWAQTLDNVLDYLEKHKLRLEELPEPKPEGKAKYLADKLRPQVFLNHCEFQIEITAFFEGNETALSFYDLRYTKIKLLYVRV